MIFFRKRKPKEGDSIALPGLAKGIADMAYALETLGIVVMRGGVPVAGRVDWKAGRPLLVIDGDSALSPGVNVGDLLRWDGAAWVPTEVEDLEVSVCVDGAMVTRTFLVLPEEE